MPEHKFVDYRGSVLVWQRNGITSVRTVAHRQDIVRTSATKLAMAGDGRDFLNMLKIFCRSEQWDYNGSTTEVLRYGFVNVGRAPVVPRNGSAALFFFFFVECIITNITITRTVFLILLWFCEKNLTSIRTSLMK